MPGSKQSEQKVVVRTSSKDLKKAAAKKRKELEGVNRKTQLIISVSGEDIQPGEIFGKVLIPYDGQLKDFVISCNSLPEGASIKIVSHLGVHSRTDTFELKKGLTELKESIEVKKGTVLKTSLEFSAEEVSEVFLSAILQL